MLAHIKTFTPLLHHSLLPGLHQLLGCRQVILRNHAPLGSQIKAIILDLHKQNLISFLCQHFVQKED